MKYFYGHFVCRTSCFSFLSFFKRWFISDGRFLELEVLVVKQIAVCWLADKNTFSESEKQTVWQQAGTSFPFWITIWKIHHTKAHNFITKGICDPNSPIFHSLDSGSCILCTPRPIYRSTYRPTYRSICRSICRLIYGRHIDRLWADISVDIAANTRPIRCPLLIGGISVDCLWSIGRLSYNISQMFRLSLSDVHPFSAFGKEKHWVGGMWAVH